MKHDELEPPPDLLARAFEVERSRVDDDPLVKEAVLRNVERAVMLAGQAPGSPTAKPASPGEPSASPVNHGGRVLTKKALGLVVAASFSAGAITGAGVLSASRPAPSVGLDARDPVRTSYPDAVVDAATPHAHSSSLDAGAPSFVTRDAGAGHAVESHAVATGESDLTRERELIDVARAALGRGNAEGALEALDRHRRSFPAGKLREERDVVRVQALVAAGREAEAATAAKRFHAAYPSSLMADVVDSAVASER